MDFLVPSFPLLFSLVLFVYTISKLWTNSKTRSPPGPWKLPLIGNLHQLTGPLPHRSLQALAKNYGPVVGLKLGQVFTLIVSSSEAAKEIMNTHDLAFADRPELFAAKIISYNCTSIIFSRYGDYWRQLRKICTLELLSAKRVKTFRSVREDELKSLVKIISLSKGVPINLTEKITAFTNNIVCTAAFGKKCEDQDEFLAVINEALELAGGFDVPDLFPSYKFLHSISGVKPKVERLSRKVDTILNKIINDHRAKRESGTETNEDCGEEDLLDVILKLQEGSRLEFPITTDNIKAVVLDIFGAGTETSATTLEWAMIELVRNPRVMEKAQAEVRQIGNRRGNIEEIDIPEMNYLKLIIKEILRLHPPAPLLIPRESRESTIINGFHIPKKTKVIINAWAMGRDPKYWENAECFEPERFDGSNVDYKGSNFEYIPFGAGRRMCPGMLFGLANIELPLAQLLYHFDWKLPDGMKIEEFDMTEAFGLTVRRKNELNLIAIPCNIP